MESVGYSFALQYMKIRSFHWCLRVIGGVSRRVAVSFSINNMVAKLCLVRVERVIGGASRATLSRKRIRHVEYLGKNSVGLTTCRCILIVKL